MTGTTLLHVNLSSTHVWNYSQFAPRHRLTRLYELRVFGYPMSLKNAIYRPRELIRLFPGIMVDVLENFYDKLGEFIQGVLRCHLEDHQKNSN
jgi:hypothetical protein